MEIVCQIQYAVKQGLCWTAICLLWMTRLHSVPCITIQQDSLIEAGVCSTNVALVPMWRGGASCVCVYMHITSNIHIRQVRL